MRTVSSRTLLVIGGLIASLVLGYYQVVFLMQLGSNFAGYPKIIHRDIKAANILVDYSFEAKVLEENQFHVLNVFLH